VAQYVLRGQIGVQRPELLGFSQNGQLATAFYDGRASMTPGIHLFFSDMAGKMNKTILEADEFMGFNRQPLGPLGYTYQLPFANSAWAFNPDLNEEELDKGGFALCLYAAERRFRHHHAGDLQRQQRPQAKSSAPSAGRLTNKFSEPSPA